MKFEQIKKENKIEYWQNIDKELGLSAEIFSHYFKKIGQEKKRRILSRNGCRN